MALPATCAFTGAYGNLSSSYSFSDLHLGMIRRDGGAGGEHAGNYATGENGCAASYWSGEVFNNEHYSKATVLAALGWAGVGVAVRMAAADSFYGVIFTTGGMTLFKRVAGSNSTLASDETSRTVGSVLEIRATGTTTTNIQVLYNLVQIYSVNDSSTPLANGAAGLVCFGDAGASQLMDDWEGGDIGGGATGHPTMARLQGIPGMNYTGRKGW